MMVMGSFGGLLGFLMIATVALWRETTETKKFWFGFSSVTLTPIQWSRLPLTGSSSVAWIEIRKFCRILRSTCKTKALYCLLPDSNQKHCGDLQSIPGYTRKLYAHQIQEHSEDIPSKYGYGYLSKKVLPIRCAPYNDY